MKTSTFSALIVSLLVSASVMLSPVFARSENSLNRGKPERAASITPVPTTSGTLKSCEARVEATTKRLKQLVRLTETMTAKFTNIKNRLLKKYQADSSKIKDYDTLVKDIDTKETNLKTLLDGIKLDIQNFDCEKGNVKTLTSEFRKDMQATKKALHEYRSSIKQLINAAREISTENKNTN